MAEILVMAVSRTHADPEKDERGCYKRGYPVVIFDDGHQWGLEEGLPNFCIVKLPGVTLAQIEQYLLSYSRAIQFDILTSDLPNDIFSIKVSTTNPTASGRGNITKAMVETFLNTWNLNVTAFVTNSVTFSADIFQAMKSSGFWRLPSTAPVVFNQTQYTQATGIHRVSANYSATQFPVEDIEPLIASRNGVLISHNKQTKVVVFTMTRVEVRNQFQAEVRQRQEIVLSRRQFYLSAAFMNQVQAAGGIFTTNLAAVQAAIQNKLNE